MIKYSSVHFKSVKKWGNSNATLNTRAQSFSFAKKKLNVNKKKLGTGKWKCIYLLGKSVCPDEWISKRSWNFCKNLVTYFVYGILKWPAEQKSNCVERRILEYAEAKCYHIFSMYLYNLCVCAYMWLYAYTCTENYA